MSPPVALIGWPTAGTRWVLCDGLHTPEMLTCPECGGSGKDDYAVCSSCSGSGEGSSWSDASICGACRGEGTASDAPCQRCDSCGNVELWELTEPELLDAGYRVDEDGELWRAAP